MFYNCHTLPKEFVLGLYSGIYVLHLQTHWQADSRTKNVFHALCILYLLSAALVAIDIASFVAYAFVSDNVRPLFLMWC
jgi:hypothetical protein